MSTTIAPAIAAIVIEEGPDYSRVVHVDTSYGDVIFQEIETEAGSRAHLACNTVWTLDDAERIGKAILAAVDAIRGINTGDTL